MTLKCALVSRTWNAYIGQVVGGELDLVVPIIMEKHML